MLIFCPNCGRPGDGAYDHRSVPHRCVCGTALSLPIYVKRRTYSASQVDQYLSCKRKWGFSKLDGIRTPPHRSAQVGSRVHKILEEWLTEAKPPDYVEVLNIDGREYHPGKIAMAGMHYLPPPGPHLRIEQPFELGRWKGVIDCTFMVPNAVAVLDHKTTTDMMWRKTEEDLKKDVQANLYAAVAAHYTGALDISLQWVYYQTRKPYAAKRTHLVISRAQAMDKVAELELVLDEMDEHHRAGRRALDLEPTPATCDSYGGCPHRAYCPLTPQEMMRGFFMSEQTLDQKLEAMRAMNGAGAPAPIPPPPQGYYPQGYVPPPPVQAPPQAAQLGAGPGFPKHPGFAPGPPTPVAPSPVDGPWEVYLPDPRYETWNGQVRMRAAPAVSPLHPPEAPTTPKLEPSPPPVQAPAPAAAPPPAAAQEPADWFTSAPVEELRKFAKERGIAIPTRVKEENLRKAVREGYHKLSAPAPSAQAAPPPVAAPAPAPMQAPPPVQTAPPPPLPPAVSSPPPVNVLPRAPETNPPTVIEADPGEPTPLPGESMEAFWARRGEYFRVRSEARRALLPQTPPEVVEAAEDPPGSGDAAEGSGDPEGFSLFINCYPSKGRPAVTVRQALGHILDGVAAAAGTGDYRAIDYGKGHGLVIQAIRASEAQLKASGLRIFLDLRTQEGAALVDVLESLADEVVKG